ncbi:hypothetical protein GCM10017556_50840 [Micromonospora sagamiensis]|nr:hypothetical protein GCM10017556_50840 [Micromonospora sagamiensis]
MDGQGILHGQDLLTDPAPQHDLRRHQYGSHRLRFRRGRVAVERDDPRSSRHGIRCPRRTVLGRNFITKYGTKQGIIVLGRVAPFGIGAVIGGGANAALATLTVKAGRRAFGPPPTSWGA